MSLFEENELFKIIKDKFFPDNDYSGVLLEVGGGTPESSFSIYLKHYGWRCIIIEPNPHFASLHRKANNEIFEFAIGEEDSNDKFFTIVSSTDLETEKKLSSLEYNKELISKYGYIESLLNKKLISVKIKKLDTFIDMIDLHNIDILYLNTNGTELKVLKGLNILNPKIIILSDIFNNYHDYMINRGYNLFLDNNNKYIYYFKEFYENK